MTLHILGASPSDRTTFESCRDTLMDGDTLLLIEDGVYWALPQHRPELARLPARVKLLKADREARGVELEALVEVDDSGFVELCVENERSVSWF
ncbi:sulfurtransferase complex subunit TusB [Marinobacterium stanieri]|uniref:sulfurtransferase complex subunit TusB n=1 Tax=Marinobacterium stanieri TaxID=49186 RepID=UPI003A8FAC36